MPRSPSPDPIPSVGCNLWTHECMISIQYWAGVGRAHRESACPPSNSTGLKLVSRKSPFGFIYVSFLGRTPKGAYSTRGRSRHLLETPFSEPLLRTLLKTPFYCKTHRRPPSRNPSENPFPRTLPRTFSEPFSERCVAVRPLRRAPYFCS